MVKALLIRGMLAGVVAGLIAFAFAHVFGEPEIEYAIALEEKMTEAVQGRHDTEASHEPAEELVSRTVQAGIGLLTAVAVYGAAMGGLFAIVFAFAYGRIGRLGPHATAALLAAIGFVSIALVPFLKYPATPPAIGSPETLGNRTALFLALIAISIIAVVAAVGLVRNLAGHFGPMVSVAIGATAYIGIIAIAQLVLPEVREIPGEFSPDTLWRFRAAALGMQMLIWATIGLVFALLAAPLTQRMR